MTPVWVPSQFSLYKQAYTYPPLKLTKFWCHDILPSSNFSPAHPVSQSIVCLISYDNHPTIFLIILDSKRVGLYYLLTIQHNGSRPILKLLDNPRLFRDMFRINYRNWIVFNFPSIVQVILVIFRCSTYDQSIMISLVRSKYLMVRPFVDNPKLSVD